MTTTTGTTPASTTAAPTIHGWELALAASLLVALTLLGLIALFIFFRSIQRGSLMEDTLRQWIYRLRPEPDNVTALIDEIVTRRYEFLTFYGQFILTALAIGSVTLLLLTGTITADAGLPVLSTILGLVLGKAVLSRRALPERPPDAPAKDKVGGSVGSGD